MSNEAQPRIFRKGGVMFIIGTVIVVAMISASVGYCIGLNHGRKIVHEVEEA